MEEWRDIKGFEGKYQVSTLGNVIGPRGIRKFRFDKNGYLRFNVPFNKGTKTLMVHKVVAETFINNLSNKETINHIDGNKLNNNINNLEGCSRIENVKHADKIGLNDNRRKKVGKYLNEKLIEEFKGIRIAERITGIPRYKIIKSCRTGRCIEEFNWKYLK